MVRRIVLLGFSLLLMAAAPVSVSEPFAIKIKMDGKGVVVAAKVSEREEFTVKVEDADGNVVAQKKSGIVLVAEFKETVLDMEKGKKATKLRRDYSKATADDPAKPLAYDGKTVLIEKKDGEYHFKIEGGQELKGEDVVYLERAFPKSDDDSVDGEFEKLFLPKKPVRVKETWKLDPNAIPKIMRKQKVPIPLDKSKLTGQGTLQRVYKKDGRRFGVIDIDITMPLKGKFSDDITALEGSKMTFHAQLDWCIDGSCFDGEVTLTLGIDLLATFPGPDGTECKMTLHGSHKENKRITELSKE